MVMASVNAQAEEKRKVSREIAATLCEAELKSRVNSQNLPDDMELIKLRAQMDFRNCISKYDTSPGESINSDDSDQRPLRSVASGIWDALKFLGVGLLVSAIVTLFVYQSFDSDGAPLMAFGISLGLVMIVALWASGFDVYHAAPGRRSYEVARLTTLIMAPGFIFIWIASSIFWGKEKEKFEVKRQAELSPAEKFAEEVERIKKSDIHASARIAQGILSQQIFDSYNYDVKHLSLVCEHCQTKGGVRSKKVGGVMNMYCENCERVWEA